MTTEWQMFRTKGGHIFEHKDCGEVGLEYVSEVRVGGAGATIYVPLSATMEERTAADYTVLRVLGVTDPETCECDE